MNEEPLFDHTLSSIDGFVDRQREAYEIIKLLHDNRLVSILGPPGIGKTSIARYLANYLRDRKKFKDGIIYVRLRG
jgi:MoxR-like ATPase